MTANVTLPGTGSVIETIDISGVERQSVTIGDRAGNNVDSIGGLTETAPATDTASSGLNGRLQRVAQRLSSIIALLPTALGTSGGLKVDGSGTALPVSGTVTANAGTNLNTSALALETGGNLATIATKVTALVTGTVLAAGSALVGIFKIGDGTNSAAIKAASTAAGATDPALVVAISPNNTVPVSLASVPSHAVTNAGAFAVQNTAATPVGTNLIGKVGIDQTTPGTTNGVQINAALPAGTNSIGSVVVAPSTTDVAVTPAVTASGYTAGNVIGGIMTFASVLAAGSFNGILQSITAKFKAAAVTGSLEVAIFKASPSNGTYTDKSAATWNAADMANLLGVYTLASANSKLGTMTIYNLDGIGKSLVGASQSLFAVVIVDGTPTPASTADFTLELSVLPG